MMRHVMGFKKSERVIEFMKQCPPGLGHTMAEALSVRPDFTFLDWMAVYDWTGSYAMQIMSLKRAFEKASTLEEWICLAEVTKKEHREQAFEKILEFDITTDGDIQLLCNSASERLRSIGWYLRGRRERLYFKKLNHADSGTRRLAEAHRSGAPEI